MKRKGESFGVGCLLPERGARSGTHRRDEGIFVDEGCFLGPSRDVFVAFAIGLSPKTHRRILVVERDFEGRFGGFVAGRLWRKSSYALIERFGGRSGVVPMGEVLLISYRQHC